MAGQSGTPWVDEDATPQSKEAAEHFLSVGVDIAGTPAARYLIEQRRIDAPHPSDLKYVEDARAGEGALLAPLYADDRIVAVQLTYIDREGRKSVVEPTKQRFSFERAPNAVFVMPYEGDSTDLAYVEGLEDALSVYRYGALRRRVFGLPGIGALRHQKCADGTNIFVVADGDPPESKGAKLLQTGLDALLDQKCNVMVVVPPEGWDANAVLVNYGVDDLKLLLKSAVEATPSEIIRLAKLRLLDYGKERIAAAKALGVTVAILDRLVERERKKQAAKAKADDLIDVDDVRQWQDEVDGVDLLDALTRTLHSFVIMTKHQARAVALWIMFTWCFDAAHCALKLWIKSPEKRSGKTRLVEILSYLVYRELIASGMSVAVFYRLIEMKGHPTVLMDEFDTWASENPEFRGMLNAGFDKRTALRWVCVGDDHTPTAFNLFCPQVIAGIGKIPDTVADRSLKIELKRKLKSENVAKLRRRGTAGLEELARKCARWSADNLPDLMNAAPVMPEAINDRASDGWELLIAIADQVGGPWPQRARQAAIKLSGEYSIDDESTPTQLFHDLRIVLREHEEVGEQVPSLKLVGWLVAMEDRPWVEFLNGRPLSQNMLARILRKFDVRPRSSNDATFRWYSRAKLLELLDRWDPEPPTSPSGPAPNGHDSSSSPEDFKKQPSLPSPTAENLGIQENSQPSPEASGDGSENPEKSNKTAKRDGRDGCKSESPIENHKKSLEKTLEQLRCVGDIGLGPWQLERLGIDDDVINDLIAQGLIEEFDAAGRRVRFVATSEPPAAPNGADDVVHNSADDAAPNGADDAVETPPASTRSSILDEVRRLKAANPSWTAKRIAAELGQPEKRIARYLP
jgi:hypothetical protein